MQKDHRSYYFVIGDLFLIKIHSSGENSLNKEAKKFLLLCCDSCSQFYLGDKHHKTTYWNAHLAPLSPPSWASSIPIQCKGKTELLGKSFSKAC